MSKTMNGGHEIAWRDGPRVIFAAVELAVDRCESTEWTLEAPRGTDLASEAAVRFAMELFKESFPEQNGLGPFQITMGRLETQPVDSSVLAVAYVAFHAICRAFSINPGARFSFDEKNGTFSLSCG